MTKPIQIPAARADLGIIYTRRGSDTPVEIIDNPGDLGGTVKVTIGGVEADIAGTTTLFHTAADDAPAAPREVKPPPMPDELAKRAQGLATPSPILTMVPPLPGNLADITEGGDRRRYLARQTTRAAVVLALETWDAGDPPPSTVTKQYAHALSERIEERDAKRAALTEPIDATAILIGDSPTAAAGDVDPETVALEQVATSTLADIDKARQEAYHTADAKQITTQAATGNAQPERSPVVIDDESPIALLTGEPERREYLRAQIAIPAIDAAVDAWRAAGSVQRKVLDDAAAMRRRLTKIEEDDARGLALLLATKTILSYPGALFACAANLAAKGGGGDFTAEQLVAERIARDKPPKITEAREALEIRISTPADPKAIAKTVAEQIRQTQTEVNAAEARAKDIADRRPLDQVIAEGMPTVEQAEALDAYAKAEREEVDARQWSATQAERAKRNEEIAKAQARYDEDLAEREAQATYTTDEALDRWGVEREKPSPFARLAADLQHLTDAGLGFTFTITSEPKASE